MVIGLGRGGPFEPGRPGPSEPGRPGPSVPGRPGPSYFKKFILGWAGQAFFDPADLQYLRKRWIDLCQEAFFDPSRFAISIKRWTGPSRPEKQEKSWSGPAHPDPKIKKKRWTAPRPNPRPRPVPTATINQARFVPVIPSLISTHYDIMEKKWEDNNNSNTSQTEERNAQD